jgi:hypothetical protein
MTFKDLKIGEKFIRQNINITTPYIKISNNNDDVNCLKLTSGGVGLCYQGDTVEIIKDNVYPNAAKAENKKILIRKLFIENWTN